MQLGKCLFKMQMFTLNFSECNIESRLLSSDCKFNSKTTIMLHIKYKFSF